LYIDGGQHLTGLPQLHGGDVRRCLE
jgi:hypothetical protein